MAATSPVHAEALPTAPLTTVCLSNEEEEVSRPAEGWQLPPGPHAAWPRGVWGEKHKTGGKRAELLVPHGDRAGQGRGMLWLPAGPSPCAGSLPQVRCRLGKRGEVSPPILMPAGTVCSEGEERGRRRRVAAPNTCGCCDACTKHRVVSERCCSALQAESSARAESCAESQLWCSDVLGRAMETGWKWNEFRD